MLLTKTELARKQGVSRTVVQDLVDRGLLQSHEGPDGQDMYDLDQFLDLEDEEDEEDELEEDELEEDDTCD